MKSRSIKRKSEPTIALINIVFLMLVFFMVAGTLAQPIGKDIKLVNASDLQSVPQPNALVIQSDGQTIHKGQDTSVADFVSTLEDLQKVRIIPDRALSANQLVAVAIELRNLGVEQVTIITETEQAE